MSCRTRPEKSQNTSCIAVIRLTFTGSIRCAKITNLRHENSVLGLVLKLVQPRKERSKFIKERVNFDNAALYYVLTSKGCLTVFEFDLEVIDEEEAYCS